MDKNRLEHIDFIVNEMLLIPSVECNVILNSAKLASEDDYLYKLMLDWMKETDIKCKSEMLVEMIDYTKEKLRWM